MKNIIKYAGIAALFFCFSAVAMAATPAKTPPAAPLIEELPQRAIDTIDTADPETKIIIYSNNTWTFYRPTIKALENLKVYNEHWDTAIIFAYRTVELTDLPSVIELKLIKDMSDFHTPMYGKVISKYGIRGRRNHNGVDIPLKTCEPIYSVFDGKVRYSKYNTGGYGNLVIIRHGNGLETWYAHLSKNNVKVNDYVKAGQIIGFGGNTGRSRGPHLHFETRYADQTFDPEHLIDFENGQLKYQTFALERAFFNIHSRASDQLEEDDDILNNIGALASSGDSTSTDILDKIAKAQQIPVKTTTDPKPVTAQSGAQYHTVKSGDTLSGIAVKYGTTVTSICKLNGIKTTTTLQLGKKLRVK